MRLPCMTFELVDSTFYFSFWGPSKIHKKLKLPEELEQRFEHAFFLKSSSLFCNMNTKDALFLLLARCDVQGQNIRVFDHLQYVANIKAGCPYVLVQEHNTDRPSRIMVWHTISIDLTKADYACLRGVQDILEHAALMISMQFSINKIHQSKPS